MPVFPFNRQKFDDIFSEFGDVLEGDPKGIDPSDDTTSEVAYLAYAVKTAGSRFRLLSLGAAPGEWAWRAEMLHRKLFPSGDYRSINMEGDLAHVAMIREFFTKHGANTSTNIVRYAVVSEKDGWAYFPITNPERDWGAGTAAWSDRPDDLDQHMTITEEGRQHRIAANDGKPLEFRTVQAISLTTLLQDIGRVDYIHCDIQRSEIEVFPGNMDAMNDFVRFSCIATHSPEIEKGLAASFAQHGWETECAFPCQPGRDGTFVWSNPRLV
jgi:hypothetical protein